METRVCSGCSQDKLLNTNNFEFRKNQNNFRSKCRVCVSLKKAEYYQKNKNEILVNVKKYRNDNIEIIKQKDTARYHKNIEIIKAQSKVYRELNKDKIKLRKKKEYQENKDKIKLRAAIYKKNNKARYNELAKKRLCENPQLKLRDSVSKFIYQALKKQGTTKYGSCIKYMDYSIQELKCHLESLFEPWMNWNNHGKYLVSRWNDNDSSTWKWNLDHIIPQSDLPYTSMEDENFKKCWALENLRPLSAKQNIIDGPSRVRHGVAHAL